jgi:hypothetical protein
MSTTKRKEEGEGLGGSHPEEEETEQRLLLGFCPAALTRKMRREQSDWEEKMRLAVASLQEKEERRGGGNTWT